MRGFELTHAFLTECVKVSASGVTLLALRVAKIVYEVYIILILNFVVTKNNIYSLEFHEFLFI